VTLWPNSWGKTEDLIVTDGAPPSRYRLDVWWITSRPRMAWISLSVFAEGDDGLARTCVSADRELVDGGILKPCGVVLGTVPEHSIASSQPGSFEVAAPTLPLDDGVIPISRFTTLAVR